MRSFLLFFLLFLMMMVSSCGKESAEPDSEQPLLMKIEVTGNYFHPQLGGIICISDPQGRTLAEARCQGDGTYSFYGPAGSVVPAWISVTTIRMDPYWHSYKILPETYTRIRPAHWALRGNRADTVGKSDPVFINIPNHNGPMLISAAGYANLTFTPGQFPVTLYKNPDNLYVGIPTEEGMKFKWFEGIRAGSADTLDLSGALNAEALPLKLAQQPVAWYECHLYGYSEENFITPIPHLINESLGSENPSGTILLEFPPGKFTGYYTTIKVLDNWSSGIEYDYQTHGAIPSGFVRISAGMNPPVAEGYKLPLNPTGSFDLLSGTWKYQSPYQGMVEWTIFGPDTASLLMIPEISKELAGIFPWLDRDSLTFSHAELTDFSTIDGYSAVLGKIFNPEAPSWFIQHELSRARYLAPLSR